MKIKKIHQSIGLILTACLFMIHCLQAQAKKIDLDFLKSQPQGIARDFYIWYFISQDNVDVKDAKSAYDLVWRKSPRIEQAMIQKGIEHEMPKDIYCRSLSLDKLQQEDADCINYGLKFSQVLEMDQKDIKNILEKLQGKQDTLAHQIQILKSGMKNGKQGILNAILDSSAKDVSSILGGLSYTQKLQILDTQDLPEDKLLKLLDENNSALNRIFTSIIVDSKFDKVKKVLTHIRVKNSDTNTFFLLGINEVLYGDKKKAMEYFKDSQKVGVDPFMQDRALFWQYLISQDKSYLQQLSQSVFADIFSITANQILGTKPSFQIISHFDKKAVNPYDFDITDPFAWQTLRDRIIKLNGKEFENHLDSLYQENTLPHLVYFLSRQYRYKYNYFIFAYDHPDFWRDSYQKAMVYAIARQESHLIPSLVSTSYALGMMQIMPFNVKPFAKSMGIKEIHFFDMFDPKIALKFGSFYLDELQKEFKNPLFVAYAYNGGPGFLRRTLAKKKLFLRQREYEPWISMELLPYEESRFYGMKVLANYVIYSEILGKKIDVLKLLEETLVF